LENENTAKRPVRRPGRRPGRAKWITIMGLTLLIVLAVATPWIWASRNSFCGSCHIMKPYYSTWTKSTHANIDCVTCHSGPGLVGQVRGKVALFRYVVVNTVFWKGKIETGDGIPNAYCVDCHSEHRSVSAGPDIKLPAGHHKMQNNPYLCIDCHKELVHVKNTVKKNVVRMKVCVDCHKKKKASTKCNVCHIDEKKK
jgi:nitrate/TMAO reductase-like tetraheme cytochrome c subunit